MSEWSVTIPGQPLTINDQHELHWIGGRPRRSWSRVFYAYRDTVAVLVQQAKPRDWEPPLYQPKLGKGLLVVEIDMLLTRDIDCDNTLKPLLDGLKVGLGTKVARTRTGKPRVVPAFDDDGFLPRFMSKQVIKNAEPVVTLTLRPL